jgi:hypothetical protein
MAAREVIHFRLCAQLALCPFFLPPIPPEPIAASPSLAESALRWSSTGRVSGVLVGWLKCYRCVPTFCRIRACHGPPQRR